tara:strand:- start:1725 stop:1952 length:228 start_codon:yes stop_codon:yes gene_type:complete
MKLFEILKAGWQALDDEGKSKVISEVSPNGILREIVLTLDSQYQSGHVVDEEDIDEEDADVIDAEFTEMKNGFGA